MKKDKTAARDYVETRRTPEEYGEELARIMLDLAARASMSQRKLAAQAEMSLSQVNRYLNGAASPTITEFIQMCEVINVRPDKVFSQAIYAVDWRKSAAVGGALADPHQDDDALTEGSPDDNVQEGG